MSRNGDGEGLDDIPTRRPGKRRGGVRCRPRVDHGYREFEGTRERSRVLESVTVRYGLLFITVQATFTRRSKRPSTGRVELEAKGWTGELENLKCVCETACISTNQRSMAKAMVSLKPVCEAISQRVSRSFLRRGVPGLRIAIRSDHHHQYLCFRVVKQSYQQRSKLHQSFIL